MAISSVKLPEYENAPIFEVVCGVMFTNLSKFLAPHFGQLWERYKPTYSECEDHSPLTMQIEGFQGAQAEIEFSEVPPLPRVWFVEPNGNHIIQVQRDRFHHNWRKKMSEGGYPRHQKLLELFYERLDTFQRFVAANNLGDLQFKQFELTYVNHIDSENGLLPISDIARIFPDFSWRSQNDRSIGLLEGFFWKTSFLLPNECGRLHVTIRNAIRISDNQPLILFELNARGIGKQAPHDSVQSWFEVAHKAIAQTFDQLVDFEFQRTHWGRRP